MAILRNIGIAMLIASPAFSQAVVPAAVDTAALQRQIQAAQDAAAVASALAATAIQPSSLPAPYTDARARAASPVQTVSGTAPDTSGNIPLPTSFSGTSCTGCTMSSPVFTGSATLNGTALATTSAVNSTVATAVTNALAGTVTAVNGVAPVSGNVALSIGNVGNVSGLAYFHRYSGVVLTIPAVGIGGTGTATANVPGTAVGDQCFVAPTSTTSLLSYIMASGWVSVAGTVKVSLAAPSVIAISATTATVNMLCAQ